MHQRLWLLTKVFVYLLYRGRRNLEISPLFKPVPSFLLRIRTPCRIPNIWDNSRICLHRYAWSWFTWYRMGIGLQWIPIYFHVSFWVRFWSGIPFCFSSIFNVKIVVWVLCFYKYLHSQALVSSFVNSGNFPSATKSYKFKLEIGRFLRLNSLKFLFKHARGHNMPFST